MKKKDFVSMILATIGGILFAIGMCACLLPEWNAFGPGVVIGAIGGAVLLVMLLVRRKMEGKSPIRLNGKAIATVLYGVFGTLVLGVGLCMTMVWSGLMIPGIIVGTVGIVLLLSLVPIIKGIEA